MTFSGEPHNLGMVGRFGAEAIGQPGDRRFRILAEGPGGAAVLWLEKEDLSRLAVSVERLLQIVRKNVEGAASRAVGVMELPPGSPSRSFEFQSGTWSVGYDESAHVLEFQAHDFDDGEDGRPRVQFWATLQQSKAMSEQALEAYSAGRPRCPLCHGPINEGVFHVCPQSNGHFSPAAGGAG